MFFPKTESRFVWKAPAAPPVSNEVTITLSHLDVNNEEMIDLMTEEELLRDPSNPSTFHGFEDRPAPQDDAASVSSSIPSEAPTATVDDLLEPATSGSEASAAHATGAIPKKRLSGLPGFPAVLPPSFAPVMGDPFQPLPSTSGGSDMGGSSATPSPAIPSFNMDMFCQNMMFAMRAEWDRANKAKADAEN